MTQRSTRSGINSFHDTDSVLRYWNTGRMQFIFTVYGHLIHFFLGNSSHLQLEHVISRMKSVADGVLLVDTIRISDTTVGNSRCGVNIKITLLLLLAQQIISTFET